MDAGEWRAVDYYFGCKWSLITYFRVCLSDWAHLLFSFENWTYAVAYWGNFPIAFLWKLNIFTASQSSSLCSSVILCLYWYHQIGWKGNQSDDDIQIHLNLLSTFYSPLKSRKSFIGIFFCEVPGIYEYYAAFSSFFSHKAIYIEWINNWFDCYLGQRSIHASRCEMNAVPQITHKQVNYPSNEIKI